MPKAYEGNEPYIFVSYAHADKNEVWGYIDALQRRGFRVWFDAGIETGSEWPQYIAEHIQECTCMLAFISAKFLKSDNCRQEITFAQKKKINQINVYIQGTQEDDLPAGVLLQLGSNQAIFRENFDSDEAMIRELALANLLAPCRDAENAESEEKAPVAIQPPRKTFNDIMFHNMNQRVGANDKERKEHWDRVSKGMSWFCILSGLMYIPLGIKAAEFVVAERAMFQTSGNITFYGMEDFALKILFPLWCIACLMHGALAVINILVFNTMGGIVKRARIDSKILRQTKYYRTFMLLPILLITAFGSAEYFMAEGLVVPQFTYYKALGFSLLIQALGAFSVVAMYHFKDILESYRWLFRIAFAKKE